MKVQVVYESMFGNTHEVAAAIAEGLEALGEVHVGAVQEVAPESVVDVDLLVVGGPTHLHGMTVSASRTAAADTARDDEDVDVEPGSEGPGLRDWFRDLPRAPGMGAAAFDTRISGPTLLTGSAAKGIARRLTGHRYELLAEPESFVVEGTEGPLADGERDRARRWGAELASRCESLRIST